MSDSRELHLWSDNPNAPKIAPALYLWEKTWFAGNLLSSILYGIVVVVFFKCMAALFNPIHRRGEPIKWGLVSYTMIMFSVVTVGTTMQSAVQSISYIDNREFAGAEGIFVPGPIGYQWFIDNKAVSFTQNVMFSLNNWLADGLLLYRCYIIYSKNLWVIAFPSLMYLGSLAMGTMFIYQNAQVITTAFEWSLLPYFSISLSLNIFLTLMIIVRLILHTRNTRTALGITGIGGLCKAIIIMLTESCALFAVSSVLVIGLVGASDSATALSLAILAETQVIAPLLIIQRVANKSALTNNTIASGRVSEFKATARGELAGGIGALPDGDPVGSADERVTNSYELGVGVQTADIGSHQETI